MYSNNTIIKTHLGEGVTAAHNETRRKEKTQPTTTNTTLAHNVTKYM